MFATGKTIRLSFIAFLCVALVRSNPVSVKIYTENNDTSATPNYNLEQRAETINFLSTMFASLNKILKSFCSYPETNLDTAENLKNDNPVEDAIWTMPNTIRTKRVKRQVNPEMYNFGEWSPTRSPARSPTTTGSSIHLTHINGKVYEIGKWSSSEFSP